MGAKGEGVPWVIFFFFLTLHVEDAALFKVIEFMVRQNTEEGNVETISNNADRDKAYHLMHKSLETAGLCIFMISNEFCSFSADCRLLKRSL